MSQDLLDTAEYLLNRPGGPTSADTCRAISTTYYALFHCIAKSCCDLFVGKDPATRADRAWNHLYRSFNHGVIYDRCDKIQKMQDKKFDQIVIDFADFTKNMQMKRERCDYSFGLTPNPNDALNDVALARNHIAKFNAVNENHRRAFAVFLLFKEDRHEEKFIPV